MSLLCGISNAISGLTAQSTCISNVSDNLANASTTAYKDVGTLFEDLVSTGSTSRSTGAGTAATSVFYNNLQGALVAASQDTYMAISGDGYFAVKVGVEDGSGGTTFSEETYYTRCGDFTVNDEGYLTNSEGYYLLGWDVNPSTGEVTTDSLVPIQITSVTDSALATSELTYDANLPSTAEDWAVMNDSTVTIYDTEGVGHTVAYSWTKTDENTWDLTITAADGAYDYDTEIASDYTGSFTVTFDGGHVSSIVSNDGNGVVSGTNISFTVSYEGADSQALVANFDELTQFADDTLTVSSFDQNGIAAGSYDGVLISEEGYVAVKYDNDNERVYYQIALATFVSENNLEKTSGNAYRWRSAAGDPVYSAAGADGAGSISVGHLESSTVDIASEFTTMIKAQQAYSANAKVITTADSMLETLVTV